MTIDILTKIGLGASIAAGALCIQSTAFAQAGAPSPQGSPSVNGSTPGKAGPLVVGDIGGGYTFKGPMTGPFSIYNRNNELVGTTQNAISPVITNDPELQKVYADNQKAHGGQIVPLSQHIEMPANGGAPGSLGVGAASTTGGNLRSQQKIPDGAIKAPNGLYVSIDDVKDKKGKITQTNIKVVDPNAASPTGIMFEYFPGSVGAGLFTSLRAGPSDYSGTAHMHPINLKPLGLDGEPVPGARVKTNFGGKGERIEVVGLQNQLAAIEAVAPGFSFDYKAFRGAFPDYGEQPKGQKGNPRTYNPPQQ